MCHCLGSIYKRTTQWKLSFYFQVANCQHCCIFLKTSLSSLYAFNWMHSVYSLCSSSLLLEVSLLCFFYWHICPLLSISKCTLGQVTQMFYLKSLSQHIRHQYYRICGMLVNTVCDQNITIQGCVLVKLYNISEVQHWNVWKSLQYIFL